MCLILRYLWEIFTGVRDEEFRFARPVIILFLIFGGCCAIFFYFNFFNFEAGQISQSDYDFNDFKLKNNFKNKNYEKIKKIIYRADEILDFRLEAHALADEINSTGGILFEPLKPEAENYPDDEGSAPPEMSIKAKFLSGKNSMIILNISGQSGGLRLKTGDIFMGGRGQVININKEYVTLRFDGRDMKIQ